MTGNEYLLQILDKYKPSQIKNEKINLLLDNVRTWANGFLVDIIPSGSRAKGTAIKGSSDIDYLISLMSSTQGTLYEIYNSLYEWLVSNGLQVRQQNVSLGVKYNGYNIDLVPAKKHPGNTNYHSLYCRKRDSWTQTNIQQHINYVVNSGRINEIKIIKIWAKIHNLVFPSVYLEHTVIDSLKYKNSENNYIAQNVWDILQYISNSFINKRVVDISNTNNIISDDLTQNEKMLIVTQARNSLNQQYWRDVVW